MTQRGRPRLPVQAVVLNLKLRLRPGVDDDLIAFFGQIPPRHRRQGRPRPRCVPETWPRPCLPTCLLTKRWPTPWGSCCCDGREGLFAMLNFVMGCVVGFLGGMVLMARWSCRRKLGSTMLQIDDAGWGCLVGGVVIGCYRVPPDPVPGAFPAGWRVCQRVITPRYFQNDDAEEPKRYARRRYLDAAAQVAATCLTRLKATPTEEVAVCSGHVLDGVRVWLTAQGYRWHTARITGAAAGAGRARLRAPPGRARLQCRLRPADRSRAGRAVLVAADPVAQGRRRQRGAPGSRPGGPLQDRLGRLPDVGLPPVPPGAAALAVKARRHSAQRRSR